MTQEQQQEIRRLRAMGEGYKRIGAGQCGESAAIPGKRESGGMPSLRAAACSDPWTEKTAVLLGCVPDGLLAHAGVPEGKRAAVRGMRKAAHGQ